MTTRDSSPRTPEWLLERIALGELPPERLAEARATLLSEPDGPERLEGLEAENAELLARHPPEEVLAEVRRRAHLQRTRASHDRSSRALPWLALTLAAAGGIVLMLRTAPAEHLPTKAPADGLALVSEGVRSKSGGPRLLIHRKDARGLPELLEDQTRASAGDALQLSYQADGSAYGVILSVDGHGAVTQHLPDAEGAAAPLDLHRTVSLPFAYVLDDAPSFERFYFVTSASPFSTETVRLAVREARDGQLSSLPEGLHVYTLVLNKSAP